MRHAFGMILMPLGGRRDDWARPDEEKQIPKALTAALSEMFRISDFVLRISLRFRISCFGFALISTLRADYRTRERPDPYATRVYANPARAESGRIGQDWADSGRFGQGWAESG